MCGKSKNKKEEESVKKMKEEEGVKNVMRKRIRRRKRKG